MLTKLLQTATCAILVVWILACRPVSDRESIVNFAVPYDIDTLDPHVRSKLSSFAVLSHFYEPLVAPSADMSIEPCLAQSWENPDLLTWIFHLRPGVRFHDGKTLNSEDVVFSIKRVMSHPEFETAPYVSNVADVSSIDHDSVRIQTKYPTAILLNKLCFIPIVPKGASSDSLIATANGTGPYRLKSFQRKQQISFLRNEKYWGKRPEIAEAAFHLALSDQQALRKLLAGECQFFQGFSKNAEKMAGQGGKFQIVRKDSIYLKYLGFNFRTEIDPTCGLPAGFFQNKLLREAIHLSIDRSRLIESLPGYSFFVTQPVPPFTFGFNPEIRPQKTDANRAKLLLKEAGVPDGFETTLLVREMMLEAAKSIQKQLSEVGIRLQLKVLPDSDFFVALRRGQFCMFVSRFGSPTGDASDILESAFHSFDPGRMHGQLNYGLYTNNDLDKAIIESSQIQGLDRRKIRLQEIMELLTNEYVWIPLYGDQDIYIYDASFSWQPRMDSLIKVWEIGR
jgi:peptide/nickel transport system substrate-binding protein